MMRRNFVVDSEIPTIAIKYNGDDLLSSGNTELFNTDVLGFDYEIT